jgi:hypothetical protein
VTSIAPASGSTGGGTSVTLTGTNFTLATSVTFGGIAATDFTVNRDTSNTANDAEPRSNRSLDADLAELRGVEHGIAAAADRETDVAVGREL